jgi:hypothetical protein
MGLFIQEDKCYHINKCAAHFSNAYHVACKNYGA